MNYKKLAIATTLGLGLVAPLATPFSEVGLVAKANEEVTFYPVPQADLEVSKEHPEFTLKLQKDKFYSGYITNIVKNESGFKNFSEESLRLGLASSKPVGYIFVTDKEITKEIAEANFDKATKISAQFEGVHYVKNSAKADFPALSKGTPAVETPKEEGKPETKTPVETKAEERVETPTPEVKAETKEEKATTPTVEKKVEKPAVKTLPETSANKNFGLYTIGALIMVLVAGVVAKIKKAK